MCTARTQIYAHVKDSIFVFRKGVGLTADGLFIEGLYSPANRTGSPQMLYGNTKTLHTEMKPWVAAYYGCSLFPGGKQPEFSVHWDKKGI